MPDGTYESNELLNQYLLFHYGYAKAQMPWSFGPVDALGFPQRCVEEGLDRLGLAAANRALDIGCSVGRSSFQLAKYFREVIGMDYSRAFIDAANTILREGKLLFEIRETGLITTDAFAERPLQPEGKLVFQQGDAQDLPPGLGRFDFVLAANLLCRLRYPVRFLDALPGLLVPGGQLVITTPNTWLEEFTAREFWLGATPQTGMPLEAIRDRLQSTFRLDKVWDMPFLIREHHRKYQWSVAQASRWIRKD